MLGSMVLYIELTINQRVAKLRDSGEKRLTLLLANIPEEINA